jgi:hypothetical protein
MNRETDFTVQAWEADEYVICYKGKPLGMTLHKVDAYTIKRWLGTVLDELLSTIAEEVYVEQQGKS